MKTIQEQLAERPSLDSQPTKYIDTVDAYDKWAEVCSPKLYKHFMLSAGT